MSRAEFESRWRTIDYNRMTHQGDKVDPPAALIDARPRAVYGQNGRGRHAAFLFGDEYYVRTTQDHISNLFRVTKGVSNPIKIEHIDSKEEKFEHGTEIFTEITRDLSIDDGGARSIISQRFLLDPSFIVSVNGVKVSFSDVPSYASEEIDFEVPGLGRGKILVLDALKSDRTTKQHGIAWWVNGRLVGEPSWTVFSGRILDGRREEAKRYSLIVIADFLKSSVLPDWSGFNAVDPAFKKSEDIVTEKIESVINDLLKSRKLSVKRAVSSQHSISLTKMSVVGRARWNGFLDVLLEKCPSLGEHQISNVMEILANLEVAESQYDLLDKMKELSSNDLDDWNKILEEWTVGSAKKALDEIARRIKIIEEIRFKSERPDTKEVQELQPLFERALWIFGPQFESIEFSSNQTINSVIRELLKGERGGSKNRPDFVIIPDGTVGSYSRPKFDEEYNEVGIDSLVVVELKKPGVQISDTEKSQAWKYVRELISRGNIDENTRVDAYVIGNKIASGENRERREGDFVRIRPLLYSTFISQAEKEC